MTRPRAQPPLVSVVIPVYNGADHLPQTLHAVARQTHPAVEIIVVDDESTDGSAEIALASGVQLQLIRQKNARVSAARNTGLMAARGEFICFLDQDDIWNEQHLTQQMFCFEAHPELGAVVSPYHHWHPVDGSHVDPDWTGTVADSRDVITLPAFTGWVYHQFLLDCWALTSATLLRRDALLTHGSFDPARVYSEDWDLWLRLSRQIQFAQISGPPVYYRQHPVQGSRIPRPIDYRSELLLSTAARHGLASPDGRCITQAVFDRTVSRYQMQFGYHHLLCGSRWLGVRSLLQAWARQPARWRYLALAAAGSLGWRPQPAQPATTA